MKYLFFFINFARLFYYSISPNDKHIQKVNEIQIIPERELK